MQARKRQPRRPGSPLWGLVPAPGVGPADFFHFGQSSRACVTIGLVPRRLALLGGLLRRRRGRGNAGADSESHAARAAMTNRGPREQEALCESSCRAAHNASIAAPPRGCVSSLGLPAWYPAFCQASVPHLRRCMAAWLHRRQLHRLPGHRPGLRWAGTSLSTGCRAYGVYLGDAPSLGILRRCVYGRHEPKDKSRLDRVAGNSSPVPQQYKQHHGAWRARAPGGRCSRPRAGDCGTRRGVQHSREGR